MANEGYKIFDHVTIAFTAAPQNYYVGTSARAALGKNAWAPLGVTGGVTYPVDAEYISFRATEDVYIYWWSTDMIFALAAGQLSGVAPVPGLYLADQLYQIPKKVALITVVRSTADGNLYIDFMA